MALRTKRVFDCTAMENSLLEERHCSPHRLLPLQPANCGTPLKRTRTDSEVQIPKPRTLSAFPCMALAIEAAENIPLPRNKHHRDDSSVKRVRGSAQVYTKEEVEQLVAAAVQACETRIRAEYEKILSEKLAEQFESFTNFNNSYISRQLKESEFSYMS
eukprot:TRINITY_DN13426_c0_g1_i1.p1 TRINITY_DN13426_c0_g1~~TRINITY_DN13426_c0_g1_i1.p1  ORF type:complete len:159 (-),score=25.30 TRINITY_DN13426_c0_g1_i1:118-594(-)